ncbi:MAG: nucleoside triphosphate pyrophosphohydrolase [Crenarchaeota archaeon]|nr:nucleoside triphosphate pyrophosphohydrolase [Thermoproteota archaeon]
MTKLVRDRIPRLCKARFVRVDRETMCSLLRYKLLEEVAEFVRSPSVEELADIVEVVDALSRCLGASLADVLVAKEVKRVERGGFEEGYVLVE